MNILVTGGAGYIGSILVPILLEQDYQVTVVDNFMYDQSSLFSCMYYKNMSLIRGDVRDKNLMLPLIQEADVIIPLACLVGAPLCDRDPVGTQTINFDSISLILEHTSNDQLIIFPTTNSGYGIGQEGVLCTEDMSLNPVSLYGRLKVDIEKKILDSGKGITLRLATVFGVSPRMRMDLLVNDFTYRAVKDRFIVLFESHFKRNYLHVRDAASVFLHCIHNVDSMKGEPYNVGLSDANLSKRELCEEIKKVVGEFNILESEISKDPDKRDYIVSNEKLESTGFKQSYSLQFGIQELVKTFRVLSNARYANV